MVCAPTVIVLAISILNMKVSSNKLAYGGCLDCVTYRNTQAII
jgi:hypothetical protein